ncbi:disulfide isomerase [Microthyrium microscopicum]|uniref:protein disulfide-isomerase n=1 Tax=Microthyrium microscopicum TaxID=703497 RepID=A0A6A6UQZ0_9PEZI|nr:disulfide isomerase [Microthyrium microscopicum]
MTRIIPLIFGLAAVATAAAEAVLELTTDNFDTILAEPQPKLIEFFAPWCGHCKNLAPIYEELAQGFQYAKNKVSIAKVDADNHKELGSRYGVQGFPTLKWFDGEKVEDYNGGRDLDALSSFITEKTGLKMRSGKAPSKVEMLNDKSFNETIGNEKNVLVAFTAPWCGHCKSLAPTWEQLAIDFANEPSVVIAKVDAESPDSKKIAEEQGITGFPTLKWFAAGKTNPSPYNGGRSESDLIEFVNKEAGTFRAPGGGLNILAGTISTIDSAIQKILDAGSSTYDDVVAAAKSEKGKYAEYYVKVANKVGENSAYVEKELARLTGIIKKGKTAPEKLDDFTSRINILQKFKGTKLGGASDEKSEL